MPKGSPRPTAGAKPRGQSQLRRQARAAAAKEQGMLPHEFLLSIARGDCIKQRRLVITFIKSGPKAGQEKSREWVEEDYYPNFEERKDAAKAAAPYYSPRLASQTIDAGKETQEGVLNALATLAANLPN